MGFGMRRAHLPGLQRGGVELRGIWVVKDSTMHATLPRGLCLDLKALPGGRKRNGLEGGQFSLVSLRIRTG